MTKPLYLYAATLLPAYAVIDRIRAKDLDDTYTDAHVAEYAYAHADDWRAAARQHISADDLQRIADCMMRGCDARTLHERIGADDRPHSQIERDQEVLNDLARWLWRQHVGLGCETYLPTGRVLRVTATGAVVLDAEGREVAP